MCIKGKISKGNLKLYLRADTNLTIYQFKMNVNMRLVFDNSFKCI